MARRPAKKKGLGLTLPLLALAAVVLIGIGMVLRGWMGPGPAEKELAVQVSEGSTLTSAARQLEKAGAINSADRFLLFAKAFGSDDPVQAGEFAIPARASASEILDILQHGKPVQRLVTVPEGMPSILVYEKLLAEPLLTGSIAVPEEGSILPDSYSFERGEPRAAVLKRMQAAMDKALAQAWAARTPRTAVSSPREAIILASIVEKETGVPAERRTVAAVYSNRLKLGMRLQADPTVIYPVTKGKPLGRRIRRSELQDASNGYNTYAIAGLPKGPIANPGRASIEAVLNPGDSRALYFVADGSGGHVFADTLPEHNANVQKWYALRRSRGEM